MAIRKHRVYRLLDTGDRRQVCPRFLDFHLMNPDADFEYPEHRHETYEIIFVIEGPYRCMLNGSELTACPGQQLVIQPGDRHQDHLKKGQRHYVLHFRLRDSGVHADCSEDTSVSRFLLFPTHGAVSDRLARMWPDDALSFFRWMEAESGRTAIPGEIPAARSRVQDARMEVLFWELVRTIPGAAFSPEFRDETARQHFIGTLQGVFAARCHGDFSVDEMADAVRCSRRSLTERCQLYFGSSPARTFLAFRLAEAARELAEREFSVKEVSERFGFDNPFHFSRAFRRVMGISPSEYR